MSAMRKGQVTIRELLKAGQLDQVAPSRGLGRRLLTEASNNLSSAKSIRKVDPGGAIQLAYDAARKAATALLVGQGLRPTTAGGHVAVQKAVIAQFGETFAQFGRMRRRRHQQEYPDPETPSATTEDAEEVIEFAGVALARAEQVFREDRLPAWS